jgi:hypothetical protein
MMLFRKDIEKSCSYCAYAAKSADSSVVLCSKKGTVSVDHSCRKFKYDPLKRVPFKGKPKDFSQYDDVDFSL